MVISDWLNDPDSGKHVVLVTLLFFGAIETFGGHYKGTKRTRDDWIMEFLSFFLLSINSYIVLFGIIYLGKTVFPDAYNSWAGLSWWIAFPLYVLVDDLAQYWYHRSAHEYDFLWKHHRPHHAAEEMGVMVSWRNSWLYYLFLPNIWWVAICTFLGMIPATVMGLIFKQLIVTSSHSTWKWDEYLYRIKFLSPVMWIVERIIITPAFHYAHHGKSKADNISDPNGNFGNAFSIWDQLFGTATFTRQFPTEFGLQTDPKDSWSAHLFYPFVRSKKEGSEIGRDFQREKTASLEAVQVELEAGTHLWCQCGYSKNQPFCDGSHHGTKFTPIAFTVEKKQKMKLCNCKQSKVGPFCDNTHLDLIKGNPEVK